MRNKTVMVTGGNSGIGFVTARELARLGAQVVIICRNREKGEVAIDKIKSETGQTQIHLLLADFRSLASVRSMIKEFKTKFPQLHVLVNNAGTQQSKRLETEDGYETVFAVNHIAPFLLTLSLLEVLKQNRPSRIINVSSGLHKNADIDLNDLQTKKKKYNGMTVYSSSKLANILFTYELDNRLRMQGIEDITVNALSPGLVRTNLGRDSDNFFTKYIFAYFIRPLIGKSAEKGAETSIWLASSPEVEYISGKYFEDKQEIASSPLSYDEDLQRLLWEKTADLAGFKFK